jgi:hypothetical protein
MRNFISFRILGVSAATALLIGCSGVGSSAIGPNPAAYHAGKPSSMYLPGFNGPARPIPQIISHYSCPATGAIEYVSDSNDSVISVYKGEFTGQKPCGQITSGINSGVGLAASVALSHPWGLYVALATHDLYVANGNGHNVLVFHRGHTLPYNVYIDPTPNHVTYPFDVTVAKDGTVIASNESSGQEGGSLSTWIGGPSGGTFVGQFQMTNSNYGGWVTIDNSDTVYFNEFEGPPFGQVTLWSTSCPAGACGALTQVPIARYVLYPGGMEFDAAGNLLMSDIDGNTNTWADTNHLDLTTAPPYPSSFLMIGEAYGMALNKRNDRWFSADFENNEAHEYVYPSGQLVGTVSGNQFGFPVGIAVDQ